MAGGIQPWWHYVAAYHEDRRIYKTPGPVMAWAKANEAFLVNRQPVATVGIAWSQRNTDFFGRNEAGDRVDAPYTGFMHALVRARIPYLPIHVDDLEAQGSNLKLLILPNVGALSDAQCASIRRFVDRGGSLLATGQTSLYNEWGEPRADFALADLFGAQHVGETPKLSGTSERRRTGSSDFSMPEAHTYLRLSPELRARVNGPKAGDEPPATGARHPVLNGFDETDIIAYGGALTPLRVASGAVVPLTLVPAFPTYPPETAWMRQPSTDIPGLVLSERGKSRVAFMPADIDRRYDRQHLPDHGDLLANVVRWASGGDIPLNVEGQGLIDCHLYSQGKRLILHLVNLTNAATWRAPIDELIRVGPVKATVDLRGIAGAPQARLLVSGGSRPVAVARGKATVEIPSILDHEVIVIG
jgi:hypothetical protein